MLLLVNMQDGKQDSLQYFTTYYELIPVTIETRVKWRLKTL